MSDQQQQGSPQYQGPPQGPPAGWQPPPPPKKKHTVRNVFLGLALVGVLIVGGCVAFVGKAATEIDKQSNEVHTVVYKVAGTSKAASLTYTTDGSTTTEQVASAKLPWSKSLSIKGGLVSVYQVMAQNMSGAGTVTCSITVDGKVVKSATGTGEASIASCTSP